MKIKKDKYKIENIKYYLVGLYMFVSILFGSSNINKIVAKSDQIITFIQIVFIIYIPVYFLIKNKISVKILLRIFVTGIILLSCAIKAGNATLLTPFIFSLVFCEMDYKKLEKTILTVLSVTIPFIILLALIGILPNEAVYTVYGNDTRIRYGMGFGHPNAFAAQIIQYVLLWVIYRWKNLTKWETFFLGAVTFGCWMLTKTQSLFIVIVLLMLYLIYRDTRVNDKLKKSIAKYVVIITPLLAIFIMIFYSSKSAIFSMLNRLVTGRFALLHSFYNVYGIKLLARKIEISNWSANTKLRYSILDNAYGQLFIIYGLLAAVVFLLAYYCLVKKAGRENDHSLLLLVIIIFAYGMIETYIFRMPYNFSIIMAYQALIYRKR